MPRLNVQRYAKRKGLYLPMNQNSQSPSLLFPLLRKTDWGELEELVRIELEKQGITNESEVQKIVDEAEKEYEKRIKVEEARREIRRLMALKAKGAKLMQVGYKKWKQVFMR